MVARQASFECGSEGVMPLKPPLVSSFAALIALAISPLAGCGSSGDGSEPSRVVAPNEAQPGSGGTTAGGPAGDPDALAPAAFSADQAVTDVSVEVHPDVNTMLVVTWNQALEADGVWLEFSFEEGNVMTSRPARGALG